MFQRGHRARGRWELPKLLTMTLEAMATCEDEIQAEMRSEE